MLPGEQPGQLPPPPAPLPEPADLIGRTSDLAAYEEQLARAHMAVITGLPGAGKTSLAAQLARRYGTSLTIFWHRIHQGESVDHIIWALAAFLVHHGDSQVWDMLSQSGQGAPAPALEALCDALALALRRGRYLLCLDDLQLLEDGQPYAQLVRRLSAEVRAGNVKLIITSRETPPFLSPSAVRPLEGLTADAARVLLARRGLRLSDELSAQLHAATGGNPQLLLLSLEGLRRTVEPQRMIEHLARAENIERYLLTEVDEGLDDDQRSILQALAALLGHPGTEAALEALLCRDRLGPALRQLQKRHLVSAGESPIGPIYAEHAIVQSFYYDMLPARDRQGMHHRAGEYYAVEEVDILKAALHFQRAGEAQRAARLLTSNLWPLINQGQVRGLCVLLEQFQEQQLHQEYGIAVLIARGEVYALLGELPSALRCYEDAIDALATLQDSPAARQFRARVYDKMGGLLEQISPPTALSWLQRMLDQLGPSSRLEAALLHYRIGSALIATGDYLPAQEQLQQSLDLLPPGPGHWRARTLTALGIVYCSQGDPARGMSCYEETLEIYQQTQNYWGMVPIWHNIAIEKEIAGDWAAARAEYHKALKLARRLGSARHQTELELSLGILCTKQGLADEAFQHLSSCLRLARGHTLKEHMLHALPSLAELCLLRGDWQAAEAALQETDLLALDLDTKHPLQEIYIRWAQVYLARQHPLAALDYAEQAVDVARLLGLDLEEGIGLRVQGQALMALGRHAQALAAFEQSLLLLVDRDPYEAARTRMHWGQALTASAQGQRLLLEARSAFHSLGARYDLDTVESILRHGGHGLAREGGSAPPTA